MLYLMYKTQQVNIFVSEKLILEDLILRCWAYLLTL